MNAMAKLAAQETARLKALGGFGLNHCRLPQQSRERDEMVLEWLALHESGQTYRSIAAQYDISHSSVYQAISAVKRASE